MAIMAVMLSITIVGFNALGRGSGLRAAVTRTRTSMSHARQYAITHRARTRFSYGNTDEPRGYFYSWETESGTMLEETNYLPAGFVYMTEGLAVNFEDTVEFKLDGSCNKNAGSGFGVTDKIREFYITEDGANAQTNAVLVYELTGRIKILSYDEER